MTYTWRGIIGNLNVWNGSGREKQAVTPPGGGGDGDGGSPGPGPGVGFTLVTLCGYVNHVLDICLTYVASDPDEPGTGDETN